MAGGEHSTGMRRSTARRSTQSARRGTPWVTAPFARALPRPRTILAFRSVWLREHVERSASSRAFELQACGIDSANLRGPRPVAGELVLTDCAELVRALRRGASPPYILFVAALDDAQARAAGLLAGADDCVSGLTTAAELRARLAAAQRITALESIVRITLAENRRLAATDDLTRVASRRFFDEHFPRALERADRLGRALSLILCDIDHFKAINETLGHAGGDVVLREFAARLQQPLRGVDWVARIGGEEFAVVIPDADSESGLRVARRLLQAVSEAPFKVEDQSIRVTASFGVCGVGRVPDDGSRVARRVLKCADAALYRSKHGGRNRVSAGALDGRDLTAGC
jgi:two-component system, cell cycle response regulator